VHLLDVAVHKCFVTLYEGQLPLILPALSSIALRKR
jgi:hypothetical protein